MEREVRKSAGSNGPHGVLGWEWGGTYVEVATDVFDKGQLSSDSAAVVVDGEGCGICAAAGHKVRGVGGRTRCWSRYRRRSDLRWARLFDRV